MAELTHEDFENAIQTVETEFREDLALHLYLTTLMRRVNPIFPPKQWFAWPLPRNEIPVAGTLKKHVTLGFEQPAREYPVFPQLEDIKNPPTNRRYRLFEYKTDPVDDLQQEIHAAIERKLRKLLGDASPINSMVNPATQQITLKIRNRLHKILQHLEWNRLKPGQYHDWQSILLAGVASDLPTGLTTDTNHYRAFTQRTFKMFDNIDYRYNSDGQPFDVEQHLNEVANGFDEDVPEDKVDGYRRAALDLRWRRLQHKRRSHTTRTSILNQLRVFDQYRAISWNMPNPRQRDKVDHMGSAFNVKQYLQKNAYNLTADGYRVFFENSKMGRLTQELHLKEAARQREMLASVLPSVLPSADIDDNEENGSEDDNNDEREDHPKVEKIEIKLEDSEGIS